MMDFLQGLKGNAQQMFSGQPNPAPQPQAPDAANPMLQMMGRVNNSINPISMLMGLMGGAPPDQFRPLWKSSNQPGQGAAGPSLAPGPQTGGALSVPPKPGWLQGGMGGY